MSSHVLNQPYHWSMVSTMRSISWSACLPCDRMIISLLTLLLIRTNLIAARTDSDNAVHHEVNICSNQEHFRCPEDHVISVLEVRCGDGRKDGSCISSSNQTVYEVCQGYQTCSNVGLYRMFESQCAKHTVSGVTCRFRCIPGQTATCRSNICAPESQGLTCSPGTTIHIQRATCSDENSACSRGSYNLMASLCEGSIQCEASGLRALLSPKCSTNQIFVDYVCVPAKLVLDSCSSYRYRPISAGFGVVRQPKATNKDFNINANKKRKKCKWEIASPENRPIHINVLLVQSKVFGARERCDPNFLRIQLLDCTERKVVLTSFCGNNVKDSRVYLKSCGPVKITSSSSGVRDANNDDFIISYQSFPSSEPRGYLSSGLPSCAPPSPPTRTPRVLTLPSKPANVSQNALHHPGPKEKGSKEETHSGTFRITLKMLLVYIFLGALILILLVALITVLVRYQRISVPKNKHGDSSENVILWKRYDDTALDVFQQNSLSEPVEQDTPHARHRPDKVTATVHHDPVPEHEDLDNRVSAGSGFSSFLPPKRDSGFKDFLDSFQLNSITANNYTNMNTSSTPTENPRSVSKYDYYELPEHGMSQDIYQSTEAADDEFDQFGGHYSNPSSLSRPPKSLSHRGDGGDGGDTQHLVSVEDNAPLFAPEMRPKDDYHYCVNDDEYAVVKKPRKPVVMNGAKYPHRPPQQSHSHQSHSVGRLHSKPPNGVDKSRRSVDFHPTSGPYDKTNFSNRGPPPPNSSYRKSREAMWRDEV